MIPPIERHPSDTSSRNGDGEKPSSRFMLRFVTLFLPCTRARLSWDVLMLLSLWYYTIMIPVDFFIFTDRPEYTTWSDIVYTSLDTIFLLDFIHHFFRPFVDQYTGLVVTNIPEIVSRYRRSFRFYLNLLSTMPLIADMLSNLLHSKRQFAFINTFNAIRLIRVLLFPYLFSELKMFFTRHYHFNESLFRMCIILFFHTSLMLILGCIYFGVGASSLVDICPPLEAYEVEIRGEESWIAKDFVLVNVMDHNVCQHGSGGTTVCNPCPRGHFLTRSIYFLMQTLFTIGYGDSVVPSRSTGELISACVFLIFGVFGYGLVIASMTSVLGNLDVVGKKFRRDRQMINRWLTVRSASDELRKHVDLTLSYLTRTQCGMLDETILNELPPKIILDLGRRNQWVVEKVPFFNPLYRSDYFLSQISAALERRIYPPHSVMIYEGERQRELIILKTGKADVYIGNGSEPASVLFPGEFIGDYQLLFDTIHHVSVRSQEFVEALVLSFHRLKIIMDSETKVDDDFCSYRSSNDQGALDTIQHYSRFLEMIRSSASKNAVNKSKSHKLQKMDFQSNVVSQEFRISPSSRVHVYWGIFSLFAILYYTLSLPIRVAYFTSKNSLKESIDWTFGFDYALDIAFVIDIYLRMTVYSYECIEHGRSTIVTDRNLISQRYLSSNDFRLNCICTIPFDLFVFTSGYASLLRVPKIIRIFQLSRVVTKLQQDFEYCMNIILTSSHVSSLMMLISSLLIIVWCSCGWNIIRGGERAYKSVYWTVTTITTVGYGDIIPRNLNQSMYAVVVGAIGATFTAAIIANITRFFHQVDVDEESGNHKFTILKCFLERHNRDPSEVKKIKDYFDYKQRENDGIDEMTLINQALPTSLKGYFLVQITRSLILNCKLFSSCEVGFLRRLMVSLEQRFYTRDTLIINESLPVNGMYFVRKGTVELLKRDDPDYLKVMKVVKADENFAIECLFDQQIAPQYLARSSTDCELWFLGRVVFHRLLREFPRVRFQLHNTSGMLCSYYVEEVQTDRDERVFLSSTLIIHPDSVYLQLWSAIVLITTLYYVVVIPFRITFLGNHEVSRGWLCLDYICDAVSLLDILLRSFFLAILEGNNLIAEKGEIMKRFLGSRRFKFLLVSSIPMELAVLRIPSICPYFWKLQTWSLFRINRLIRIIEVGKLFHFVEDSFIKAGFRLSRNALRAVKLFLMILLTAHIIGCLFFLIAALNQNHNISRPDLQRNWAKDQGLFTDTASLCPDEPASLRLVLRQYVASIYYVVATLTTVGYGDITANKDSAVEVIFATVFLITGTAFCSMVIGLLEDIFSQLDVTTTLHQKNVRKVAAYISDCQLPEGIKTKVSTYYNVLWKLHKGVHGDKVLESLPSSIRSDVMMDMLAPILSQSFFFSTCSRGFLFDLSHVLHLEIYITDDMLFNEGQISDRLFVIYKGDFDLCTAVGHKFMTVSNCVIDEASFFLRQCYSYSARSVMVSEVFILSIDDFNRTLYEAGLCTTFSDLLLKKQHELISTRDSLLKMVDNFKSSKMAKMIITNCDDSVPKGLVLPTNKWRQTWDCIAMIQVVWLSFSVPYYLSFFPYRISMERLVLDVTADVFFLFDSYARAKKFTFIKNGSLILDRKEIRTTYIHEDFGQDILSLIPASLLGYIIGVSAPLYSWLRLFQFIRVARFWKYFRRVLSIIEIRRKRALDTSSTRLLFVFILMVFLCHVYAAIYHMIGKKGILSGTSWIIADQSMYASSGELYLRSFYWALYTLTTTGYGVIPVLSNGERIFAIFAMISGAAACDAGITALLSSMVNDVDEQSSENSRRLKCSKKYMSSIGVENELYERVLSYYSYADNDLKNISETSTLDELSPCLKTDILKHFCFKPLRHSCYFNYFSDGALLTILESASPYVAVPGELLSEAGKYSNSIYTLQRGMVRCRSSTGTESLLPLGSVIGHDISLAEQRTSRGRSKALRVELIAAHGLKSRHQNPYLIFSVGSCRCRSSIMKTNDWRDVNILELPSIHDRKLRIEVKTWQKGPSHPDIGAADIPLSNDLVGFKQDIIVYDNQGKKTGIFLKLDLSYIELLSCDDTGVQVENTVISIGYSHLYRIDRRKIEDVKTFLIAAKDPSISERLDKKYFGTAISGLTCSISSKFEEKHDQLLAAMHEVPLKASVSSLASIDESQQQTQINKGMSYLAQKVRRFSSTYPSNDEDKKSLISHNQVSDQLILMKESIYADSLARDQLIDYLEHRNDDEDYWDYLPLHSKASPDEKLVS